MVCQCRYGSFAVGSRYSQHLGCPTLNGNGGGDGVYGPTCWRLEILIDISINVNVNVNISFSFSTNVCLSFNLDFDLGIKRLADWLRGRFVYAQALNKQIEFAAHPHSMCIGPVGHRT